MNKIKDAYTLLFTNPDKPSDRSYDSKMWTLGAIYKPGNINWSKNKERNIINSLWPKFSSTVSPQTYKNLGLKNKGQEAIGAANAWASVLLVSTPEISQMKSIPITLSYKDGTAHNDTAYNVANFADYILGGSQTQSQYAPTSTSLFSNEIYAWLLQMIYYDSGLKKIVLPDRAPCSSAQGEMCKTTLPYILKSQFLSGYGPTYVFPYSDFLSADKSLISWPLGDSKLKRINLFHIGKKDPGDSCKNVPPDIPPGCGTNFCICPETRNHCNPGQPCDSNTTICNKDKKNPIQPGEECCPSNVSR